MNWFCKIKTKPNANDVNEDHNVANKQQVTPLFILSIAWDEFTAH